VRGGRAFRARRFIGIKTYHFGAFGFGVQQWHSKAALAACIVVKINLLEAFDPQCLMY
jgi:hypothetical protein